MSKSSSSKNTKKQTPSPVHKFNSGNGKSTWWKGLIIPALVIFIFSLFAFYKMIPEPEGEEVKISELVADARENKVEWFKITDDRVEEKLKGSEEVRYARKLPADDFREELRDAGVDYSDGDPEIEVAEPPVNTAMIIEMVINGAMIVGIVVLAIFIMRGLQSSGSRFFAFGESRARMVLGKKQEVSFKDVAGCDEAKAELEEVVMFLKEPKKFAKLGARIPKGLLLVGPPGTGKTLLARAIAGEAGVPFFHTSGAEFEEMLVGAGASRVRDLFKKAKRAAPALIFIDEIDAVARKRGTTIQSGTTEQTLNQILVELDGFEKHDNVIVIAATNRPDVLDPALLRPGRFDRRVVLDLPDIKGRKEILQIHTKNKPLAEGIDLERVAKRTVGFSGADLENMLNEAAILAVKAGRKEIAEEDFEEAAIKVVAGPERKRKRTERELKMTAYHEAGHAIVTRFTPEADPVHRITIISRGMSLGSTMKLPQDDELIQTKGKLMAELTTLVAGHVAEKLIFGETTTGAASDIEKASVIARKMVKRFGMSDKLGPIQYGQSDELEYLGYAYGGEQKDYSEQTSREIDEEIMRIIDAAYQKAEKILSEHRELLDRMAERLLKEEVIEGKDFEEMVMEGD